MRIPIRDITCLAAMLWLAVASPLTVSAQGVQQTSARPNIVIVLADDLGYGEIQRLNPDRGKIPTPNLNRLFSQGMTFTDAHSASSVCTPSRYALLTGRYCWRTRLQSGVLTGGGEPLIADDRLTIAELLRQQGYATAAIGKWHLNYHYESPPAPEANGRTTERPGYQLGPAPIGTRIPDGPLTRGFDSFLGFHHSREMSSLVRDDRIVEEIPVIDMLPRLTHEAVEYIEKHAEPSKSGQPFFLYLPLNSPHTPIVPSPQWQGKSGLGDYGDFVMQTDAAVGEVLTALDQNGIADQTLLIFSSDNGTSPAAGIDVLQRKGHFPSGDFRGAKSDIWDGGHRVPFLIRWPGGGVPAGTTSPQLVCQSDILATVAEMLDCDLPGSTAEDSFSFFPVLTGKPLANGRSAIVHHSISGRFAIRRDNWKLCLCYGSGGWGTPVEKEAIQAGLPKMQLYDLNSDIAEQHNRIDEHPEKVAELLVLLQQYLSRGRSNAGPDLENDAAIDLWKASGKLP